MRYLNSTSQPWKCWQEGCKHERNKISAWSSVLHISGFISPPSACGTLHFTAHRAYHPSPGPPIRLLNGPSVPWTAHPSPERAIRPLDEPSVPWTSHPSPGRAIRPLDEPSVSWTGHPYPGRAIRPYPGRAIRSLDGRLHRLHRLLTETVFH
ncbi:hypothetical protein BV898_03947 [Hypsibius exemplaris]|uniref:Uncharacterized protein n=1 Tax=Hypsibius exemplaris TaxID=2072580 RepID=A0A1W0X477_HYPEX|nr:hypothetical protein BV898_03947 [Hypsibius exemplaris]